MISIGISVVLIIGLLVATTKAAQEFFNLEKKISKGIVLLGFIPLLFGVISIIPANTLGIKYSPISGTQDVVLQEGLYFKSPIDKIYKLSTEVQTLQIEKLYGQTRDAQYINITVDVKFSASKENAFVVFKNFKTLKNVSENLVKPTVQRSIEAVVSNYGIIDVLGEKRNNIYLEVEKELRERFSVDGIEFHSVTFLDTDAGEDIEKAITQEAIVAKEVETAKQQQEKTKIEAETLLINAQAEADVRIIGSKATAEQLEIEAMGKLKSYETKNTALNDNILFLEWLNKWNGELPRVQGQSNSILDVSEYMNK